MCIDPVSKTKRKSQSLWQGADGKEEGDQQDPLDEAALDWWSKYFASLDTLNEVCSVTLQALSHLEQLPQAM